ncbi:MarR family transcriptional regulator [Crassaminicella profunda]|uniref:MarR family transcriptional regulator n=1 Tax=Crassaminicella profunda TaxID=1286698 RepID=UPI001CA6673C|nr:MarR family transcriptional regulator [Crassaminicella profunda]QZY56059.1 winged helix DNA-binding protein [Crassaminicella profunda]
MDIEIELLNLFARFMEKQEVFSKLNENGTLHGFGHSEVHTISAIKTLEKPNVTKISRKMNMTRGAISKITRRLIAKELIETYKLDNNKKEKYYKLTEKGESIYRQHEKAHNLWIERDKQFMNSFSKNEIEFIKDFMIKYNLYLDERMRVFELTEKKAKYNEKK